MLNELLTVRQVASQLNLSMRRVQQFCKAGRLGTKLGDRYIITQMDVIRFENIKRINGRPKSTLKLDKNT